MLKEQIEQLKQLLGQMQNPNPLEFARIKAILNEYGELNNPNVEPIRISHEELSWFIADKFRNFEFQRQLRDKSRNLDIKTATGAVVAGLFYEIVFTIKNYDPDEWVKAGFDINDEEMNILKGQRNNSFHVPTDMEKFVDRHKKIVSLDKRLFDITFKNSGSLLKYMLVQRSKYPQIDAMLETAFKPSREPNFLWDNYKP